MTVESLSAHSRRLRVRRAYETIRTRVLPVVLVAVAGVLAGFALAGGGGL